MLCALLCDHWATAHKGEGVLRCAQCAPVFAREGEEEHWAVHSTHTN